jgi:hypothetical protein
MALSLRSERLVRAAGDPFARITTDDHSAMLWVVTLLSTIYAVLVLLVRLGYTKRRAYALDDIILTIAYVCIRHDHLWKRGSRLTAAQLLAFGMWTSLWTSLRSGLGRKFDLLDDARIARVQWVSCEVLFKHVTLGRDVDALTLSQPLELPHEPNSTFHCPQLIKKLHARSDPGRVHAKF